MIPCPVCSQPMPPTLPNGQTRVTCSRPCRNANWSAIQQTRNTDIDQVTVLRLLRGERTTSTRGERIEACRVLTGYGRTYTQIAAALHVSPTSVWRYHVVLNQREKAA